MFLRFRVWGFRVWGFGVLVQTQGIQDLLVEEFRAARFRIRGATTCAP